MQKEFNNRITDFLIDNSPIKTIKIIRNDYKIIKEIIEIPKNLSVWEILNYVDILKIKIVKLLVEDRKTFLEGTIKSYKILCNDLRYIDVENIIGLKQDVERIVQVFEKV